MKKAWALMKADLKEANLPFGIVLVATFLFIGTLTGWCSKDLTFEKSCLIALRSFAITSGMLIFSIAFVLFFIAIDPKYKEKVSL